MNPYIYLLIALAFATTLGYLVGREKNRRIGAMIGTAAEEVLQPEEKEYVNIGGTLGYNFTFRLTEPFTTAKGTFTLLPRHSILYLPLSLLIARHDRFYVNLFTENKLQGEGHIIAESYYPRMRVDIAGIERMKRGTAQTPEGRFILLWDNPHLERQMRSLLEETPGLKDLLHFCCYRDNKTFFIHAVPRKESLRRLLQGICLQLPAMMKN